MISNSKQNAANFKMRCCRIQNKIAPTSKFNGANFELMVAASKQDGVELKKMVTGIKGFNISTMTTA